MLIKCVKIEPKKHPEIIQCENTEDAFSKVVHGEIVRYPIYQMSRRLWVIANRNGEDDELDPNRPLINKEGRVPAPTYGTMLVVEFDEATNEYVDMNERRLAKVVDFYWAACEFFIRVNPETRRNNELSDKDWKIIVDPDSSDRCKHSYSFFRY